MKGFTKGKGKGKKFIPTTRKSQTLSKEDMKKFDKTRSEVQIANNKVAQKLRSKKTLDANKTTFSEFLDNGRNLESEVRSRAEKGSPHFFDADTMRFFSSRISDLMWEKGDDIYFVTSEADKGSVQHSGSTRAYTVRVIDAKGDITEIGDFQEHEKLNDARHVIHDTLEGDTREKKTLDDKLVKCSDCGQQTYNKISKQCLVNSCNGKKGIN